MATAGTAGAAEADALLEAHADVAALDLVIGRLTRDEGIRNRRQARLGWALKRLREGGPVDDIVTEYARGRWRILPSWWAAAGIDLATRARFLSAVRRMASRGVD